MAPIKHSSAFMANLKNARRDFKVAQRRLLVLETQEKVQRIQSYFQRVHALVLSGDPANYESGKRLLDAVCHKMESRPLPSITMSQLDNAIDVQNMDSSVIYQSLHDAQLELEILRHKTMNFLCMEQVKACSGCDAVLRKFGINDVHEILSVDVDVANQMAAEAVKYSVDAEMQNAIIEFADSLEPLMAGDEIFTP